MMKKVVDNQNVTKVLYVFNIGCLNHPKKNVIVLSRKLSTFESRLWRQKLFRIKKQLIKVFILHLRMYESSRKSYIIMLSQKLLTFKT